MTDDLMSSSTWYFALMLLAGLVMMTFIIIGIVVWPVAKGASMLRGHD